MSKTKWSEAVGMTLSKKCEKIDGLSIDTDDQRYRQALEWIVNFPDHVILNNDTKRFKFVSHRAEDAFLRATYYPWDGNRDMLKEWVPIFWREIRHDYRKLRHASKEDIKTLLNRIDAPLNREIFGQFKNLFKAILEFLREDLDHPMYKVIAENKKAFYNENVNVNWSCMKNTIFTAKLYDDMINVFYLKWRSDFYRPSLSKLFRHMCDPDVNPPYLPRTYVPLFKKLLVAEYTPERKLEKRKHVGKLK